VNNTVITLNEFFENEMGIMMYGVANTTVSTNTLTATYLYGIDLAESDGGNIIAGNTITANTDIAIQASYVGIRLWGSRHTMISDNTLISLLDTCHGGLELWMSADNAIQHNIFVKNGVLLYNSYQNTISDDNTVNGKPLIFLREETNKTVENAGQVILVQCDRIIVRHCELSYVQTGVTLLNTTNSDIVNNTIYSCNDGIQLEGSHANTLFQNSIMNCEEGVYVATSPANNIVNNSIRESTYYGILTSAMSITISGNVISDNPVGISIVGKRNNKIIGNIIENSSIGIELTATIHTTIEKNNFIRNACDAFFDTAVRNYWRQNYWEKPTRLPHLIRGYLVTLEYYPPFGGGFVLRVPWVNVDWHPARVPYEISFPSSS
jgi:parallel beta-helix repeat protein